MNLYTYEHRDDPTHPFKCNFGGYAFPDEERARTFCEMWNDHHAAMATIADIPARISRQEYEAACTEHGCTPLTDADCCGYGVTYGEFKPWLNSDGSRGGNSPQQCIAMALAGKRQRAIRDEKAAQPKSVRQPVPMKMCACGHAVPIGEAMSASLGSSCPGCYDRMSN